MENLFPYTFSLNRRSRAGEVYEVFGRDFDSLVLKDGVTVRKSDAVFDEDGLLSGHGISVENFVNRVGPEAQSERGHILISD